ncbi:MAG: hypothetical protein M1812_005840 [Candelaria pacifica]|nr:MAG: hypothetical protein M1812_005840 [Candelaria pacifica]
MTNRRGEDIMSNVEPARAEVYSSVSSTPALELESAINTKDHVATLRGKGGRKPIYNTSEERKQRNRQAQAAFRKRRTEYIEELEKAVKHYEDKLYSLNQRHLSTADGCLQLRYKNSLLERILFEKGIDVQTELDANVSNLQRTSGSDTPATVVAPYLKNQRASINCHQRRRGSTGSFNSSINPETFMPPETSFEAPHRESAPSTRTFSSRDARKRATDERQAEYKPSLPLYSPSLQNHMDQLEQEYNAQGEEQESSDYSVGLESIPEQSTQQPLHGTMCSPRNLTEHFMVPQLSSDGDLISIASNNCYQGPKFESNDDSFEFWQSMTLLSQFP